MTNTTQNTTQNTIGPNDHRFDVTIVLQDGSRKFADLDLLKEVISMLGEYKAVGNWATVQDTQTGERKSYTQKNGYWRKDRD